ncbi:toxin-activating lysine-acyltransferase [Pseudogulbenkiania ferrooxidans]|uniref:toxin-activating lysine-acyltransferase n=1 Tax=Pseudogulbenkiania ferrooxidans TaxID=549169 RepID=UPI000684933F|nr:toxin-activating lysine-acyltransferase [Pseudogulbenkiania ferrooxidans]
MEKRILSQKVLGKSYESYEKMGMAVHCMLLNKNYRAYPIITLEMWTFYAVVHNQISFLFSSDGKPIAYITWAYMMDGTVDRLLNDPQFLLHPSEWDEEGNPWVLDFCCTPGLGSEAIKRFLKLKPWKGDSIKWLSRKKKIFTKIVN